MNKNKKWNVIDYIIYITYLVSISLLLFFNSLNKQYFVLTAIVVIIMFYYAFELMFNIAIFIMFIYYINHELTPAEYEIFKNPHIENDIDKKVIDKFGFLSYSYITNRERITNLICKMKKGK